MGKQSKVKFVVSIQSDKKASNLLTQILAGMDRMEKLLMGIKEDFQAFVNDVNTATNGIATALNAIAAALLEADPASPTDLIAARDAAAASLKAVADQAEAIAAGNQPVVPPEPL
jgi:flagellar hook-associated protein FlgK